MIPPVRLTTVPVIAAARSEAANAAASASSVSVVARLRCVCAAMVAAKSSRVMSYAWACSPKTTLMVGVSSMPVVRRQTARTPWDAHSAENARLRASMDAQAGLMPPEQRYAQPGGLGGVHQHHPGALSDHVPRRCPASHEMCSCVDVYRRCEIVHRQLDQGNALHALLRNPDGVERDIDGRGFVDDVVDVIGHGLLVERVDPGGLAGPAGGRDLLGERAERAEVSPGQK